MRLAARSRSSYACTVRHVFSSAVGFLCVPLVAIAFAGCEEEALPTGFSFEAGVPSFDAARFDGSKASDAGPPETTLTSTPAAISKDATAKFEFVSSQPGGAFACQLDEQAPAECTSPHSFPVTEGVHTFKVSAVSAISATAVDLSPATFTWTVDLTAPTTTITKSPAAVDNTKAAPFEFTISEPGTTTCAVDDGSPAPCTSPFTTGDLADGDHTVRIVATDLAGNAETPAKTFTWTLDTTTPDTTIESGPAGAVSSKTATFTFTSTVDPSSIFACALDGDPFTTCTSPVNLSGLAEGDHTFRVRASDLAHNQDITPAERTWTVDTIPPTATITDGPNDPTNDAVPAFTFTTAGATVIECRFDAAEFAACTSPLAPGAPLGDGPHTFEVKATDAAGNTANATRSFSVDTVNPGVTITGGPTGATKISAPVFTFATADGATGTECRIDTADFAVCTSPFTTTLLDGPHTFDVRALDAAGNVATATQSFTVDTLPPTVTISGGPNGATNDTTPTFEFTTVGATSTECRFDAASFTPCVSPFTPLAMPEGSYTFEVRAVDAATNAASTTRSFTIDTTVPSIVINSGPSGPTKIAAPSYTFTPGAGAIKTECSIDSADFADCTSPFTSATLADGPHTFDVRALDAAGNPATASRGIIVDTQAPTVTITGGPTGATNTVNPQFLFGTAGAPTTVECRLNGGAYVACSSPFTAPTLAEGSYTFEVRVVDAATNASSATQGFSIDTTAPSIVINTGPSGWTNNNAPQFTFTAALGATVTRCSLDGSAFALCSSPFNTGTLSEAEHNFTVRAYDAAGNFAPASRTFTVDTIAPTVSFTGGPNGPTNVTTPTFQFTTTGGATSTSCSLNGGAFTSCTSPFTTGVLGEGSYTLAVRATDAALNSATTTPPRSFSIDTSAPTVEITSGPTGATNDNTPSFGFTSAGSTFKCRIDLGNYTDCSSPFTSAALLDGEHTFSVQATDAAGNSASVPRPFVVDTLAPVVTISEGPGTRTNDPLARVWFSVAGAMPGGVTCAVDGGNFNPCTSPFGSATALSEGVHTLRVRAVDAATNADNEAVTFTVDITGPFLQITSNLPQKTNDNFPTFTFNRGIDAVLVECSFGESFEECPTGSYHPGDPLGDGPWTFTVRAYDDLGNESTASRSFTVDTYVDVTIDAESEAVMGGEATGIGVKSESDPDATLKCRWVYRVYDEKNQQWLEQSSHDVDCLNVIAPTEHYYQWWTFEAIAYDPAGNTSEPATRDFIVFDPNQQETPR